MIAFCIGRNLWMQVNALCVRLQDGRKTQKGRIKKEYWQKYYSIFHRFWDLNICFRMNNMRKVWYDIMKKELKMGSFGIWPIPWLRNKLTKYSLKETLSSRTEGTTVTRRPRWTSWQCFTKLKLEKKGKIGKWSSLKSYWRSRQVIKLEEELEIKIKDCV